MMKHSSGQSGIWFSGFGHESEKCSRNGACSRRNFMPCSEPQHDCSLSNIVMISRNSNSSASLAIILIINFFFLFFFYLENETINTIRVLALWFSLPSIHVSLHSNLAWKPSKLRLPILFSLWGLLYLLTL